VTAQTSFKEQVMSTCKMGFAIMALQTPIVHPLNRMSVIGSDRGYSFYQSLHAIFKGTIDKQQPSLLHLYRGISGHVAKEVSRLMFKPLGALFKPKIDETFPLNPIKAAAVFAGIMAIMEMMINPFDTIRVRLQKGEPLSSLYPRPIKQLYAGSMGNGVRQFGTWGIFYLSGSHLDKLFRDQLNLDTQSIEGLIMKSCVQATLLTSVVYPLFERLKNELQCNPALLQETTPYKAAFRQILQIKGPYGLLHGIAAKILSNAILTIGFNGLIEISRPAK